MEGEKLKLNINKILYYILIVILAVILLYLLYQIRKGSVKILTPFAIGAVIAYILNPAVSKLEKRRIPRWASITIIYLAFVAMVVAVSFFVIPEIISNTRDLMITLPDMLGRFRTKIDMFIMDIQSSSLPIDIKQAIENEVRNNLFAIQSAVVETLRKILNLFTGLVGFALDFSLGLVIAFYFLKDREFFKKFFLSLVPVRWKSGILRTASQIDEILSRFLQGQINVALIVGALEVIGLTLAGIKFSFVLGMVGGFANIIPYFGPFLGAIPAVAVAFLDSPVKAIWAAVVFMAVQQIDNAFISPRVMQDSLGMHPVTTILAILIGGEFFGLAGMFLAVPVAAVIKILLKKIIQRIV